MVEFHPCNVVFAFGTFNHNQMQGKGCSHVLTCTREASRLYSSICLHGTKSNQHSCALKTIRISIICFEASTMCFQIMSNIHWYKRLTLNVFWRPKPNLLTMVELPPEPKSASKVKSLSPYPKSWSLKMCALSLLIALYFFEQKRFFCV